MTSVGPLPKSLRCHSGSSSGRRTWRDGVPCPINKVIWICWLQGWEQAPWLVRKCLTSWQVHNPDWEIRAVDRRTVQWHVELPPLQGKQITAASMSDIIRTLLLHEYGGVWVDATLLCRQPLDDWLPDAMRSGFFAFDRPGPERPLSSWFIACTEGHPLMAGWYSAVLQYWRERDETKQYFWFHYLFGDLCESDPLCDEAWSQVPKISAAGPHCILRRGLLEQRANEVADALREPAPVFKLTYRFDATGLNDKTLLWSLLSGLPEPELPADLRAAPDEHLDVPFSAVFPINAQGSVDLISLVAGQRLLARGFSGPSTRVDQVVAGSELNLDAEGANGSVLRGNHPVTSESLAHGDIAPCCVDLWALSLPRRVRTVSQTEVFVVASDSRLPSILPSSLAGTGLISIVDRSMPPDECIHKATGLLTHMQACARLIVTTSSHCALAALAMGIPVVMFSPEESATEPPASEDCLARLAQLIPIHSLADLDLVDWEPKQVQLSFEKLQLLDTALQWIQYLQMEPADRMPPLAPSTIHGPASMKRMPGRLLSGQVGEHRCDR